MSSSSLGRKVRIRVRFGGEFRRVSSVLAKYGLATVCEQALCPNIGECWGSGTATFMILGDVCTRGCRFCYVRRGRPAPPDPSEPRRVALAVRELGLRYVTLTSVTRDDLEDGGASHYAATIAEVKKLNPGVVVEALTPDFGGSREAVALVVNSGLDVFAHNIETVRRLTPMIRDPRFSYDKSLAVLEYAKNARPGIITKSSILLGFGERVEEVVEAMRDLREAGVDILVLSQYYRPSPRQVPVAKYYTLSEFRELERIAYKIGFRYVLAHPLARTSYKAYEAYLAVVRGVAASKGDN